MRRMVATARVKSHAKAAIEAKIRQYAMEMLGKAHAIACDEYVKAPVAGLEDS